MSILLKRFSVLPRVPTQVYVTPQRYKGDKVHSGYARLRKIQAKFQVDDGCPVHLKKGISDRILFGVTVFAALTGLFFNFGLYYTLIFPSEKGSDDEG
ncbi:cytochrome c oxidase subunit 7A1, mitochondrial-like [Homalodisca vitripennis]|uniref:cytochrome c oxidase subunit 7A1, mitochondrial-like n=1 Tax=Homalodisca vitripennis TaxID=197043 RepID=UPI001EEC509B|nr:cytochrome c oxidase subunit 7A1, mitochondrial-like [Homalodisca vitripennis]